MNGMDVQCEENFRCKKDMYREQSLENSCNTALTASTGSSTTSCLIIYISSGQVRGRVIVMRE